MGKLKDIVATEVDGKTISFEDILKTARSAGNLGFLKASLITLLTNDTAVAEGISVSDEDLQTAADNFRQQNDLQSASATMDWLKSYSMTEDSFEDRLRSVIFEDKLKRKVIDGQQEKYFAENSTDFQSAVISQIVLNDENLANEIISQIEDEEDDFTNLARQHSIDPVAKATGGFIGEVKRAELSPTVQAAVFGASDGSVVGPVKTDAGFHVIKVETLNDSLFNDDVKHHITNVLFNNYMNEKLGKLSINWKLLDEL